MRAARKKARLGVWKHGEEHDTRWGVSSLSCVQSWHKRGVPLDFPNIDNIIKNEKMCMLSELPLFNTKHFILRSKSFVFVKMPREASAVRKGPIRWARISSGRDKRKWVRLKSANVNMMVLVPQISLPTVRVGGGDAWTEEP